MMGRVVLAILFAGLFQSPAAPRRGGNPEAAGIKNPVEATAGSVAAGKRHVGAWRSHLPGVQPPDLTDAQWDFGGSDGEIFSAIHDGTSADMDGYAARLSDAGIWNVVNYLRTLSAGPP